MHRARRLLPQILDFNNLYRAFLGASHGKRDQPEVREFEYHLETRLWEIHRLSRSIFAQRDVDNLGKRLLAKLV